MNLGTLGGGNSVAAALNNANDVVGWSQIASGAQHAFLYMNGTMQDLNLMIPHPRHHADRRRGNRCGRSHRGLRDGCFRSDRGILADSADRARTRAEHDGRVRLRDRRRRRNPPSIAPQHVELTTANVGPREVVSRLVGALRAPDRSPVRISVLGEHPTSHLIRLGVTPVITPPWDRTAEKTDRDSARNRARRQLSCQTMSEPSRQPTTEPAESARRCTRLGLDPGGERALAAACRGLASR